MIRMELVRLPPRDIMRKMVKYLYVRLVHIPEYLLELKVVRSVPLDGIARAVPGQVVPLVRPEHIQSLVLAVVLHVRLVHIPEYLLELKVVRSVLLDGIARAVPGQVVPLALLELLPMKIIPGVWLYRESLLHH